MVSGREVRSGTGNGYVIRNRSQRVLSNKRVISREIKDWKQACIAGNANNKKAIVPTQSKTDKKLIKQLEKELNRKEKALAETAALLVLRKKFNAYCGGDEDN